MRLLAIFCIFVLAGCATPEQRAEELAADIKANYAVACTKLGYAPDSEGHRNCMLSLYNTDQVRMAVPPQFPMFPPAGHLRR